MIRKILPFYFYCVFLFSFFPGSAQKEFFQWYFGNGAGLDFSSGRPEALTDGKLYTEEGCASVSDANGNLLFYTNGINAWNRTHQLMPNGSGLAGGISSTQSAVILPVPGTNHKYYIFTVAEKAGVAGLSYSIVDLLAGADKKLFTKNQNILLTPDIILSAARPDVILKNTKLTAPVSEKITAVKNSRGDGFWIIVHQWNSDAFYVFPVTQAGIGKPVISNIGSVHKESGAGSNREAIGCLSASADGKKLCSAVCYKPGNDVELFDFDNSSGKISNLRKIPTKGFAYGIVFSPDNSKLYVSFLKGEPGIIQYDLNAEDIAASAAVIAWNKIENIVFGALQRGPDKKIYIAKTGQHLDVIHKPDEKGVSCGYEEDGMFLGRKYSVYGLPADVLTLSKTQEKEIAVKPERAGVESDCKGKIPVITLPRDTEVFCMSEIILDAGNEGAQFLWSNKVSERKITVKESGIFSVTVTNNGCSASGTVKVEFYEKPTVFNYLPEFKPTNAMLNNSFQYSVNDVKSFEIKVFSPRGKIVFETTDPKKYWNGKDAKGKELPAGNYQWIVKYQPKCGSQATETKEGTVKLQY